MAQLSGKVALVTGGSRGIGAATAKRLAAEGAKVGVNYNQSRSAADQVVNEIMAHGGEAVAIQADVGSGGAAALIKAVLDRYGRLDILVNNAAVIEAAALDVIDEEQFDRQFRTNVKAPLFLAQAAARVFGEEGGSIVNVSSINSRYPAPRVPIYSATKAALEALTVSLSRDLGPRRIRVNAVAPGQTDTDMLHSVNPDQLLAANIPRIALGRLGTAEEIAAVIAFLASDDARWITGEILRFRQVSCQPA
jgi:3-oxoacyl-[acyl-carrier protein] reductase